MSADDRAVLRALYEATDGPNWLKSSAWLTDKPLGAWHGVTTNHGRVIKLNLKNNRLVGTIPLELARLSYLVTLDLSKNALAGGIPPVIGRLSALEDLYLSRNQLTGRIPHELSQLSLLEELYLDRNNLMGEIPSELERLTNLGFLNLKYNQLTVYRSRFSGQVDGLNIRPPCG